MSRKSIDRKIFWLLILLPCLVNFGCGKKNLPSEPVVIQQRETKTGREIFLEKTQGRKEKSDLIKDEKKIIYAHPRKSEIDEQARREELNTVIKKVTEELKQIAQDKSLSEEEKNNKKKRLKEELREFIIEGPCDIGREEMESILKDVESEE